MYNAGIIYPFLACYWLTPVRPLLHSMRTSIASLGDKSCASESPINMSFSEIKNNYDSIIRLCDDFCKYCGDGILLVHTQCFFVVLCQTYTAFTMMTGLDVDKWFLATNLCVLSAFISLAVPNYVAEGIVREARDHLSK